MPNWCSSDLTVSALPKTKEERKSFPGILKRFINNAKGERGCLDMNKFIPYPDEYAVADKKAYAVRNEWDSLSKEERDKTPYPKVEDGFNHGGYEWCLSNWGSKWNFSDPELLEQSKLKAIYRFETPWSPPARIIFKMSEMFPQLEFELKYYEAGMAFQGTFAVKNGIVVKDKTMKYNGGRGG